MADARFNAYVRAQLTALPEVEFRRMFGGQGIYLGDVFFGILYRGRLYLKTDASSRPAYEAAGMGPFFPTAKQCLPAYREVPGKVLEDAVQLCAWARRAARRAKEPGNPKKRR